MNNEENMFEDYQIPINVKDLPNPFRNESIWQVLKDANRQFMEETTPAGYATLTALSLMNQALIIKGTRNRFPRFSKGYTIYCAIVQVLSLGMYVRAQRRKMKRAEMQGLGVCLHCGHYPCQCEEVDIWRTEDQLKGFEPTDLEKREGLPEHTRPEKREWMITHGLCPQCGDKRDPVLGCAKHS